MRSTSKKVSGLMPYVMVHWKTRVDGSSTIRLTRISASNLEEAWGKCDQFTNKAKLTGGFIIRGDARVVTQNIVDLKVLKPW